MELLKEKRKKMFKKFVKEMLEAQTPEEINYILFRRKSEKEDYGVGLAYQCEKLSWKEYDLLFKLSERLIKSL